MMRSFDEYIGGGFWIHVDGAHRAIIKTSTEGWYGGACTNTERSVPLHGPYRFARTAKKRALEKLDLLLSKDGE